MVAVKLRKQKGIALAYLIAVITLLTVISAAWSLTSRSTVQAQWNSDTKRTLLDQYQLIVGRLVYCGVAYPAGDNGTGFRGRFPGAATSVGVDTLVCPGQAVPNNLWSGIGGLTLPATPARFSPWSYTNDATSMRIAVSVTAGVADTQAIGVLDNVVALIGQGAVRSGATMTVQVSL